MDVAAAVDVTIMTTNPLKIPTRLIGPIIINGQPDLSGFQLGGRSQHQNLKVEGIRNPQLHLDGLVRLHQKFLLTCQDIAYVLVLQTLANRLSQRPLPLLFYALAHKLQVHLRPGPLA
ncbi:hypothetical protein DUI87_19507 [Hirundo rustica rustica]|uniref:Uncharacterized protein n=1 Tax=Hirundo rustica rustica TaxID=333673 RepID=A0A3M0JSN8_HIRRU|nr:hypothetical protein DUI87_19507 [Hirundo rustica rustica]